MSSGSNYLQDIWLFSKIEKKEAGWSNPGAFAKLKKLKY